MQELKVVSLRVCPSCGSHGKAENTDYDCPSCGTGFCSECYKTDTNGTGDYVFCPSCGTKLNFPAALRAHA